MTTLNPAAPVQIFRLPTRLEWRYMLTRPSILITVIVCVTWVVTLLIGGVVFLAYNDRGTEALVGALVVPIVGALVAMLTRTRNMVDQVQALERAVIQSPNIPTDTPK